MTSNIPVQETMEQQIAREKQELESAPRVTCGNMVLRCHFCGQLTPGGTTIYGPMALDGGRQVMQLKGVCCGG